MRRPPALLFVFAALLSACGLSVQGYQYGENASSGAPDGSASSSSGAGGAGGDVGAAASPWWNPEFTHRIKITFDNASRATNLVNFPAVIRLDAANFPYADAESDGHDLRFVDSDNVTVLPYDVERWAPGKTSSIWVKVPKIRSYLSTDHIWLYYGNPSAKTIDSSNSVWSGHVAVYHLNNDPAVAAPQIRDSTVNKLHATILTGSPVRAAGVIDDGLDLFAGEYFSAGNIMSVNMDASSARTVEAWFKANSSGSGFRVIFSKEDNCRGWRLALTDSGVVEGTLWLGTKCAGTDYTVTSVTTPSGGYDDDKWHHAAFSVDRSATVMRLYIDGEQTAAKMFQAGGGMGNGPVLFGDDGSGNTHWYDGVLDEIRVSLAARTDDWVSAEVASARGTFASLSGVEDVPPTP